MTIKKYIKEAQDLLENNLTDFLDGANNALTIKKFDELVAMLRQANIPNIDGALDPLLADSLEFYVRYIFDNEEVEDMLLDEFVEKVLMPMSTHLSKTHKELVDWIEKNSNKIKAVTYTSPNGTFITKE